MLIVIHKEEPKRMSRWSWKKLKNGMIKWSIESYINGYYQACASRDGVSEPLDFQSNIDSLMSLSPDVFEVQTYL